MLQKHRPTGTTARLPPAHGSSSPRISRTFLCRSLPKPQALAEPGIQSTPDSEKPPLISPDESVEDVPMDSNCRVFIDRDGNFVKVMCCDYGFRTGVGRMYQDKDGQIPKSAWQLGMANFKQEYNALRRSFRYDEYASISEANPPANPLAWAASQLGKAIVTAFAAIDTTLEKNQVLSKLVPAPTPEETMDDGDQQLTQECLEIRSKLRQLKLSNQAVWDREHQREAAGRGVATPLVVKAVYLSLCLFLDVFFENRPIQRFWFLETVARMPYFSYISMLHLYESLGWWRAGAELRKVHFAEEWNELHHLQIMETLGGDQLWVDRFMAQHAAIVYYWVLVLLFLVSPDVAYNFSELIEAHAVDTYGEFVDANEELLKSLPPPLVAAEYYRSPDLYMFDEFQTAAAPGSRRPKVESLYDVFCNIRDDEGEHVATMKSCQQFTISEDLTERKEGPRPL